MTTHLELTEAIAEIGRSPEGPHIGAFFDMDGTLVAGFTARHLTEDRLRKREIGVTEVVRTLGVAANAGIGRAGFVDLLELGAGAWRGRAQAELDEMGEDLFRRKLESLLYPEMREIVRAHQQRGHTVVLSSSATSYQAEPVARYLGIDQVLCNRFTVVDGCLTGEVERPVLWGAGKADAVRRFADSRDIDLATSSFYADGDEDLALMEIVGNPRPTNPARKLAAAAAERGWPVLRFTSRGGSTAGKVVRTLAGLGSIVPLGWLGAGIGLATRDKREMLNFTAPTWLDAMFMWNDVHLEVAGRDNLWVERPAVFIFNHRNNFDAFMTARLVERNFTGVAKEELRNDPIMGTFGRLADVAFIDRSSPKAAVDALKPVEDLARSGLSVIIAPEGTRIDTHEVGPFKKGAFRIAMATGLPIVPIVIHDAERVAARNAATLNAGTVHITVLPPISVTGWTARNLAGHVQTVRQLYLDTLATGFDPDQESHRS